MNHIDNYNKWLNYPELDSETKRELECIRDDENEIKERFGKSLEFGTGGMRGIMGAGTNRMNAYIVRRTTQGIAHYMTQRGENNGVVIAYDSRNHSAEYAMQAALVLAANDIKAYLFDDLRPTPELSFAVRHLKATAGIVITASHNPKEYNGYKVYWDDGGQLPPHVSDKVLAIIDETDIFSAKVMDKDAAVAAGKLQFIGAEIDEAYYANVLRQLINTDMINKNGSSFKLAYTPFHGAGNVPVREVLKRAGFNNVTVVPEQEMPDGNFPTVVSPNPEDKEGFEIAIKLARQNDIDLIIGTDPDSDRVGAVARGADGEYNSLTGNQVGALLTHYILLQRQSSGMMPPNPAIISTIVSTRLTREIARKYDVAYIETLTGFKFIAEKIYEFEKTGCNSFLFGFEESYGYLAGTYCRDKDAVVTSALIAEMALYYNGKGMTLMDALAALFEEYGYYSEKTVNIKMEGLSGLEKMAAVMKDIRENVRKTVGQYETLAVRDYLLQKRVDMQGAETQLDLPKSNVIFYELQDGFSFVIRPSGTEPKIKIYILTKADSRDAAEQHSNALSDAVKKEFFDM